MALKITSGGWLSAASENQRQRDDLRKAFFAQAGVKPAASLRDVFLAPADRIERTLSLLEKASRPRIEDTNLSEVAILAIQALGGAGLGVPVLPSHFESRPLGISALAPEVLNSFFAEDRETALGRSLF